MKTHEQIRNEIDELEALKWRILDEKSEGKLEALKWVLEIK